MLILYNSTNKKKNYCFRLALLKKKKKMAFLISRWKLIKVQLYCKRGLFSAKLHLGESGSIPDARNLLKKGKASRKMDNFWHYPHIRVRSSTFWPCVEPWETGSNIDFWHWNSSTKTAPHPYLVFAENIFFNNNFCNLNLSVFIHSLFSLIQRKAILSFN